MKNTIIILDKNVYRNKEEEIRHRAGSLPLIFYYTEYEDDLIRKVCKWKYVGEILLHILYWFKSFRYAIKIYNENDGGRIVSINPIVGIFLGMLNKRQKYDITLAGFLFEPKRNKLYYSARVKLVSLFLKGIDTVVVYAEKEVEYYKKIFGVDKFQFVQYGIDYDVHEVYKGSIPVPCVFSGGRSNRDFHTLIEAYRKLNISDKYSLCIATRPVVLQNERLEGITVLKDVVLETFGNAMEQAAFVVLPLMDTEISAGHQVLLEALERNMIVITSRIEAVEDYVTDEQVLFYEPGNETDLEEKMMMVIDDYQFYKKKFSRNREFYENHYTFICFIERLLSV